MQRPPPTVFTPSGAHPLSLLVVLVMAHFLCDFSLQSDRMAREKSPGRGETLPWGWWLTAHVSTHGLAVALLTGSALLGGVEAGMHAWIDYSKCVGRINFTTDQILHLLCKVLWVGMLARA